MSESLKEIYSGCENHTRLLWHFVSKLQQLAGSRCFFSWYPTQLCWSISILCCLFWFRKTSQQLFKRDPLGLLLFLLKGASCICFSCRDLFKSHPQQQLPLPLVFSLHGELSLPLKYDEFTPEHKLSCPFNPHLWMQQGVPVLLPCPGSSSAQMLPKEGYKTHLGAAPHLPQVWEHPRRGRYVKLSTEHIVCHGGHLNLYNLPGCRLWADTAAASQPPHPSKAAMEGFSCCAVFTLECNSNTFPLFSDLYKIKTGSRLPSDWIRRVCLQSSLFCGCGVFLLLL